SYTLVDKGAVSVANLSPIVYYYVVTIGQLLFLTPFILPHRAHIRKEWERNRQYVIGVGILNPLAYISVLTVMTFVPVSYVAPVREISILIGTIMGTKLLSEKAGIERSIGALLMVLGVVIIA